MEDYNLNSSKKNLFLQNNLLFNHLDIDKIKLFGELFNCLHFAKNEKIFSENEKGESLYLIYEGKVLIYSDNIKIAERIKNECIGEMAIIDDSCRSASAIADTDVIALELSKLNFLKFLKQEPIIGIGIFRILSYKLREDIIKQKKIIADLENANKQLKKLDELKINILSNISHELRTPLTVIRGYNELLFKGASGELNDKQKNQVSRSLFNIENLSSVIDNLIEISNLKSGLVHLNLTKFDIRKELNFIISCFSYKLKDKNIDLQINASDSHCNINADKTKLGIVLKSLIDNAIKFNKENGRIFIELIIEEYNFIFIIKDTGIGITEQEQKNIFDFFYQIDSSTTRKFGGNGLGLTICKEIINLHNGIITVQSEPEKGSIFTFIIPVSHTS